MHMTRVAIWALVALWCSCFLACGSPPIDPPDPEPPPAETNQWTLQEHNEARADNDKDPLLWDDRLAAQAQEHADSCEFSHDGFLDRLRAAGFDSGSENLAGGYVPTAQDAVDAFMGSDVGHKDNVLGNWTHMGAGWAKCGDGWQWTVLYGLKHPETRGLLLIEPPAPLDVKPAD